MRILKLEDFISIENYVLRNISWIIYENPIEEMEIYDEDYNYMKPDEAFFNKVLIEKNHSNKNKRYLVLPVQRFAKNYKVIVLSDEEITIKELLLTIYKFYNEKVLTFEEIKEIDDDDVFNYVTDACNYFKKGEIVHYIDVMGDKRFYEFIYSYVDGSGDTQYILSLAS